VGLTSWRPPTPRRTVTGESSNRPASAADSPSPAPSSEHPDLWLACSRVQRPVVDGPNPSPRRKKEKQRCCRRAGLSTNSSVPSPQRPCPSTPCRHAHPSSPSCLAAGPSTTLNALVNRLKTRTLDLTFGSSDPSVVTDATNVGPPLDGRVVYSPTTPQINQVASLDPSPPSPWGTARRRPNRRPGAGRPRPRRSPRCGVDLIRSWPEGLGVPRPIACLCRAIRILQHPWPRRTRSNPHIGWPRSTAPILDGTVEGGGLRHAVTHPARTRVSTAASGLPLAGARRRSKRPSPRDSPAAPAQTTDGTARPFLTPVPPARGCRCQRPGMLALALVAWRPMAQALSDDSPAKRRFGCCTHRCSRGRSGPPLRSTRAPISTGGETSGRSCPIPSGSVRWPASLSSL